jgi:hypothetical protein
MTASRRIVCFINIGHAIDHMFVMIFPTGRARNAGGSWATLSRADCSFARRVIAFVAGSVSAEWLVTGGPTAI